MRRVILIAAVVLFCARSEASVLYQQPPNPNGGFYHSAWWDPDGSNYDQYVWDAFVLGSAAQIDSIQWRGAYDPAFSGGPVVNFTVGIYASIAAGTEPDVSNPPLVEYEIGDNAGETAAGVFGGVAMYDYGFTLPASFSAAAGVRYWVLIEGWQWGFPNWSIASGQGGDGSHFRCLHVTLAKDGGVPTGCYFSTITGDAAISLRTATITGVDAAPGAALLELRGASPNPSHGDRLDLSFRLASAAPAQLALFDVGGRRVAFAEVGALGAGAHVVNLASRAPLAPGIYVARLSQGGDARLAKVTVVR